MEFNNTTCITETEEINELIDDTNQYLLILQGIILSVIGIVGMVINIFVMTVILANKQLHTRPFMLSLQVIAANIIVILVVYVPSILTNFVQVWLFGSTFCNILGALVWYVLIWRWPVMFLMILDRLLTVTFPFCYKRYANKIMTVLSVLLFFFVLLYTLAPLVDIGCYTFTRYIFTCTIAWQCHTVTCYLFYIVTIVVVFIIGTIAPTFMYVVMLIKARNLRKDLMIVSQSTTDSSQYKISGQRAQKTILLLFISLVCLTLPSWLFFLIVSAFDIWGNITWLIVGRILYYGYMCVPIGDAVVILRNRDIKSAIRKNMNDRGYNCCSKDTYREGLKVEST